MTAGGKKKKTKTSAREQRRNELAQNAPDLPAELPPSLRRLEKGNKPRRGRGTSTRRARNQPRQMEAMPLQPEPDAPPDLIQFDEAVAQARQHIEAVQYHERKLGELADRLEPKYGDETLAKFAEEIGVSVAHLSRCRSTYRAYKDQDIKETTPNFAVLAALQAHPLRAEIIKAKSPNLTVRQARTHMRDYRLGLGQTQAQPPDQAEQAQANAWADAMENALAPPPAPMFDDEPGEASPSDEAAPDEGTPDSD